MTCLEILHDFSRILFVGARCVCCTAVFSCFFTYEKCWPDFVSWEDKIHKAILDNFATPRVVEVSEIHPVGTCSICLGVGSHSPFRYFDCLAYWQ